MSERFENFDRYARPIGRHLGWVYLLGGIIFLMVAGGLFLLAMYQWAMGRLAISWAEIGALIAAMGGAAASLQSIIANLNNARSAERIEQIRVGAAPPPLAVPSSEPSSSGDGGLVNNEALR